MMNIENGNNDINKSSITNGKFVNNWRIQRCSADDDNDAVNNENGDATNGNDTESKLHHHTNGNGIHGYPTENGGHRSYFKRSLHSDHHNNKYPLRMNGLRKSSAYFQENGGGGGSGGGGGGGGGMRSDIHDIYENSTQHSQYR